MGWGGICPILDLHALNKYDWFTSVDLIDAYFHIPICPPHRKCLLFAFHGVCCKYHVLPSGSLPKSKCVRTLHRGNDHPAEATMHLPGYVPGRLAAPGTVKTGSLDAHVLDTVMSFLTQGVSMGTVLSRKVITMDAHMMVVFMRNEL